MQFLKVLGIIVLLVAGGLLGTELYFRYCNSWPEIASGLPKNTIDANREFDRRIKEHFPVGSLEKDVVTELERQGFPEPTQCPARSKKIENCRYTDKRHMASIFMAERVVVVWYSNNEGQIVDIKGSQGLTGP